MEEAAQSVVNAGATAQWDEKTQQNYAKWSADGGTTVSGLKMLNHWKQS